MWTSPGEAGASPPLAHTRRSRAHILTASATTIHENGDGTDSNRFPDCSVIPGNPSTEQTGELPWGFHETKRETTAGEGELEDEAIEAGDLDLSGGLEERDVELMRQALDSGETLPSALLDEFAYPGGVVAMVSPALQDPDADIEVFVDGERSPQVMRAILGYATFVVPASLVGEDAEVEVVVEADGAVAERPRLLLKPSVTPAASAKEDVLAFLTELAAVVAGQQEAGADFVAQNGGLSADESAIVLGAAKAAAEQIEGTTDKLEVLLNGEGGEGLAAILQAALYANGLAEFRESTRTAARNAEAPGAGGQGAGSAAAVCDTYVPAICAMKDARSALSLGSKVANGLCTAAGLASAPALVASLGTAAPIVAFINTVCVPLTVAMNLADVITEFVEPMKLGMRLSSDKAAIENDATATITAEVTFLGLNNLCTHATSGVSSNLDGKIVKTITRLLLKKSKRLGIVQKTLKKLKVSDSLLLAAVENSVAFALTRSGFDGVFKKAVDALCRYVGHDAAGEERAAGLQADGLQFNLQASNGPPLRRNDNGTYSLACPAGFSGTVVVAGNKTLCSQDRRDFVRVSCEGVSCDGSADTVNIQDADLRAAIEERLGKAAGESITPAEMATLRSLFAPDRGIGSLTGLECATGLRALDVRNGQISDVSPLSGLPALTTLYLDGNRISDVSPLSGLPTLTTLHITSNLITDVSQLSGLTALENLDLSFNEISNIGPLVSNAGLGRGDYLDLLQNPLSKTSQCTHIPALAQRGVRINYRTFFRPECD